METTLPLVCSEPLCKWTGERAQPGLERSSFFSYRGQRVGAGLQGASERGQLADVALLFAVASPAHSVNREQPFL